MEKQVILDSKQFDLTLTRLCHELIEQHSDFSSAVLIGLQPRGIHVVSRLRDKLERLLGNTPVCGTLDITFYRDDFRRREKPIIPNVTNINFSIEGKSVIMVDDVLFTGRTIRSGMDALLAFGRPKNVQLLVLVDRRFSRDLPIQADYIGKSVDTLLQEKVKVSWLEVDGEDKIELFMMDQYE
jgi:pyrimidine operon attenuation protein/uracil phosphoribosyltransferase